jgi:hypothetical protein
MNDAWALDKYGEHEYCDQREAPMSLYSSIRSQPRHLEHSINRTVAGPAAAVAQRPAALLDLAPERCTAVW